MIESMDKVKLRYDYCEWRWEGGGEKEQRQSIDMVKLRRAYVAHRDSAKQRGIGFEFTFEEWLAVWIESGKLSQRGRKKGQYVMSRPGDAGPYRVDNVRIITVGENARDEAHRKRLSESGMGRVVSDETRLKLSEAGKRRYKGTSF